MHHTPGPWASDSTATGATVYQEMAGTIATIPADLLAYRANARLIAAAPELLSALHGLLQGIIRHEIKEEYLKHYPEIAAAHAAIRAATAQV